jgi:hypothetical protein
MHVEAWRAHYHGILQPEHLHALLLPPKIPLSVSDNYH